MYDKESKGIKNAVTQANIDRVLADDYGMFSVFFKKLETTTQGYLREPTFLAKHKERVQRCTLAIDAIGVIRARELEDRLIDGLKADKFRTIGEGENARRVDNGGMQLRDNQIPFNGEGYDRFEDKRYPIVDRAALIRDHPGAAEHEFQHFFANFGSQFAFEPLAESNVNGKTARTHVSIAGMFLELSRAESCIRPPLLP